MDIDNEASSMTILQEGKFVSYWRKYELLVLVKVLLETSLFAYTQAPVSVVAHVEKKVEEMVAVQNGKIL